MTKEDRPIERLTNLTFAFLGADKTGRRFLSADWIRRNVKGYGDKSQHAAQKQLTRDIAVLARAGVPVETVADEEGTRYRLQADDYPLPEVQFTPDEAAMLGLAGEIGRTGELAAFTRSGWTKLAASGASRALSSTPVFNSVNDLSRLAPQQLETLLEASRHECRISFNYHPDRITEPVRREMDPWGIVNHRDRLYLVGFDPDRQAPRSFRIFRVSEITPLGRAEYLRGDQDLQQIVAESLRIRRELIDAVLRVDAGQARELTERAEPLGQGRWRMTDVDRNWLLRTAAGHAPAAVVEEPLDLREEIQAMLGQAGEF